MPDSGYSVERGLAYGEGPRRRLDLYRPEGAAPDAPTVVFFYGGNWRSGSRADYRFVGQALASRGYRVAIPDYRLYPQVRYPAFLEDGAAATAWVRRALPKGPLYLAGHSAGAYIAVMLGVDARWLEAVDLRPCESLAAVAGLAGPYDFLPLDDPTLERIFGAPPTPPETQPVEQVDGDEPPLLLVSGRDDETVLPDNSRRLAERVRAAGGSVETRFYDGVGHVALAASLGAPLRFLAPALDDLDAFLGRHPAPACDASAEG